MRSTVHPLATLCRIQLDGVDWIAFALVLVFFGTSAVIFHGVVDKALLGALGIVGLMVVVSHSIHLIIGVLSAHPKLGELTGYITNGPEALVVIVGLIHQKLFMAMGVPLGSNFANPVLLTLALVISGSMALFAAYAHKKRFITLILTTAALAASFFLAKGNPTTLGLWAAVTFIISVFLYCQRGKESPAEEETPALSGVLLLPAILLLVVAGYYLDPVVGYTAQQSHVPEGVISFVVLSFMTSWPEFRTASMLLAQKRLGPALMNIVISNITNVWLAVGAAGLYLLLS